MARVGRLPRPWNCRAVGSDEEVQHLVGNAGRTPRRADGASGTIASLRRSLECPHQQVDVEGRRSRSMSRVGRTTQLRGTAVRRCPGDAAASWIRWKPLARCCRQRPARPERPTGQIEVGERGDIAFDQRSSGNRTTRTRSGSNSGHQHVEARPGPVGSRRAEPADPVDAQAVRRNRSERAAGPHAGRPHRDRFLRRYRRATRGAPGRSVPAPGRTRGARPADIQSGDEDRHLLDPDATCTALSVVVGPRVRRASMARRMSSLTSAIAQRPPGLQPASPGRHRHRVRKLTPQVIDLFARSSCHDRREDPSSRSLRPSRMASNSSSLMSMSPVEANVGAVLGRKSTRHPIDLIGR